ncbi:response regulator transcription factor [Stenotrophomonas sp. SY1]|uniref:response regulator transcription factor n=1 Tax=Stenotrophomonas sp. SY1 TaxID=477235 RepID=UPI001E2B4A8A|nr:response regulator transcription factor [Stenotrophomonas sp. SY1]MCD9085325.1 response regulator transcription factor [Stenotrophomonas sp. SY1]
MSVSCMQSTATPFRRVLVADDHMLVAQGIERLLTDCFESIELVASGEELVEALRRDPADVVVADISMPGISGIDAMRVMRNEGCPTPFVFLTMHNESNMAVEALRAGARGYVLKSAAGEELVRALNGVMDGQTYVSPTLAANAIASSGRSRYTLTEKQLCILEYVARGLRSKQIAYELGVSVRTVESHKYAIMQALGVHGTLELVRRAEQEGLIRH